MNAISLMAADPAAGGSMSATLITFVLIILIFYFLIIRPQKKRDKEAKAMIDAMKKGDKVVTIGGIHGTIVAVRDQTVVVKVDDSARIEFSKSAISTVSSKDKVNASAQKKDDKNAKAEAKAEATRIAAEAEADANAQIAASLTPELIDKIMYEKWNGELPTVSGSNAIVSMEGLK